MRWNGRDEEDVKWKISRGGGGGGGGRQRRWSVAGREKHGKQRE